jgi:hypothetical protein
VSEVWLHRTVRVEDQGMGSVVVTYKIFPSDITVSFDDLKKRIEASLPKFAEVYGYGSSSPKTRQACLTNSKNEWKHWKASASCRRSMCAEQADSLKTVGLNVYI